MKLSRLLLATALVATVGIHQNASAMGRARDSDTDESRAGSSGSSQYDSRSRDMNQVGTLHDHSRFDSVASLEADIQNHSKELSRAINNRDAQAVIEQSQQIRDADSALRSSLRGRDQFITSNRELIHEMDESADRLADHARDGNFDLAQAEEAKLQSLSKMLGHDSSSNEIYSRTGASDRTPDGSKTKSSEKVVYTCPMHPEVAEDHAGRCPKCGMELIKKKSDKSSSTSTGNLKNTK